VYDRLQVAAKGLEASGRTVADAVAAYERARGSLEAMTETLRRTAEEATKRADLSRAVVADMERLVQQFEKVQGQTETYLDNVSGVLTRGFDDFSEAVVGNMDKARAAFDKSLSEAVQMISMQIQDLDAALEGLKERV